MTTEQDPTASIEARMYLDLLKKCLTRQIFDDDDFEIVPRSRSLKGRVARRAMQLLASRNLRLVRRGQTRVEDKIEGIGWPAKAETMMGVRRLDWLESTVVQIVSENIPGDFFEAGCWRGGAVIFLLGALRALRQTGRVVWAADSFAGYPAPTASSSEADHLLWERHDYFAVSRADFEQNVARYGLGGDALRVLEGFFDQSIPKAPIERLAMIRIDIDGYEGVSAVLDLLYPKLSPGGFVVVDELEVAGCKRAIDEFFARNGLDKAQILPIQQKKTKAAYWRKSG